MRKTSRLTALQVPSLGPGRHADGDGLVLEVSRTKSRRWLFVFRFDGRRPEMGLGGYPATSLAEARRRAQDARALVAKGVSPLGEKRRQQGAKTFGAFTLEWLDRNEPRWRNRKHRQQWRNTLTSYTKPIWQVPLAEVSTELVLACVQPIWTRIPETASRVRGRIEVLMDAAYALGLTEGSNPARWKGHLSRVLPRQKRLVKGHHAALAYGDVPALMLRLAERDVVSANALRFTILTAARTGEVLGARWPEIDMAAALWTVPAERMKAKRKHVVPLSTEALRILEEQRELERPDDLVFPSHTRGRPLSGMSMPMLLRRLAVGGTVHGFRSSFRDWAGDETDYPFELVEQALAHSIGNKVALAYRRGTAVEKRRPLMQAWSDFLSVPAMLSCDQPPLASPRAGQGAGSVR